MAQKFNKGGNVKPQGKPFGGGQPKVVTQVIHPSVPAAGHKVAPSSKVIKGPKPPKIGEDA